MAVPSITLLWKTVLARSTISTSILHWTLGLSWGNAPDAVANRVALEACVQAHNKRLIASKGPVYMPLGPFKQQSNQLFENETFS